MPLPRVFLDLSIGGTPIGRIIIELFIDQTPVTCENFRRLCTSSTIHPTTNQPLTYTGTLIHRIIPYFVFQGGDVTSDSSDLSSSSAVGTGGHSALGTATFADENLHWRSIDAPGLVCMANRGPGTNSSQFFVTLHEDGAKWLTGRNTVFGRVVEGMEVVKRVEKEGEEEEGNGVDEEGRPRREVRIVKAGELVLRRKGEVEKEKVIAEEEVEKEKVIAEEEVAKEEVMGDGEMEIGRGSVEADQQKDTNPPDETYNQRETPKPDEYNDNTTTINDPPDRSRYHHPRPHHHHSSSHRHPRRSASPDVRRGRSRTSTASKSPELERKRYRSRSRSQHRRRHRHHRRRSRSRSPREHRSDRDRDRDGERHHRRHRHGSRSRRDRDDGERGGRRDRERSHRETRDYRRDDVGQDVDMRDPEEEARIEREEREREMGRLEGLEIGDGEVKFKGRGSMKFRERKSGWGGGGYGGFGRLD